MAVRFLDYGHQFAVVTDGGTEIIDKADITFAKDRNMLVVTGLKVGREKFNFNDVHYPSYGNIDTLVTILNQRKQQIKDFHST